MNTYDVIPAVGLDTPVQPCVIWQFWSVRPECAPPFEPTLINQDDSKQWEYLLSQENHPSFLAGLILHLSTSTTVDLATISFNITTISFNIMHEPNCQKGISASRATEADDHENGQSLDGL